MAKENTIQRVFGKKEVDAFLQTLSELGDRTQEQRAFFTNLFQRASRFAPETSRCVDRQHGRNLASWACRLGERWIDRDGHPSLLVQLVERGIDTSVPDAQGRMPTVDAWGDLELLSAERVEALRRLSVDCAAVNEQGWSVLSFPILPISTDFPCSPDTLHAIRSSVAESLERLEPNQRQKRLKLLLKNVHPDHENWFNALIERMQLNDGVPKKSSPRHRRF